MEIVSVSDSREWLAGFPEPPAKELYGVSAMEESLPSLDARNEALSRKFAARAARTRVGIKKRRKTARRK